MSSSNRIKLMTALPIGVAVVLMLVTCRVQGVWSERWGTFPELEILANQLDAIPLTFGQWQGEDRGKSEEKIRQISGAVGETIRTYKNAAGEEVRVSIICGRQRDVFYHTPERCYPAAGFDMQAEPVQEVIETSDGKPAEFFTATFTKSEPTGTHSERGYWSWSGDGTWLAPKNHKWEFAGHRALYKLYVFATIPGNAKNAGATDFCVDFIREFIPVANAALQPGFEKAGKWRSE